MKTGTLLNKYGSRIGHCYAKSEFEIEKIGRKSLGLSMFLFQFSVPHYSSTKDWMHELNYMTMKTAEDFNQTIIAFSPESEVMNLGYIVPKNMVLVLSIDSDLFYKTTPNWSEAKRDVENSIDFMMEDTDVVELHELLVSMDSKLKKCSNTKSLFITDFRFNSIVGVGKGIKECLNDKKMLMFGDRNSITTLRNLDFQVIGVNKVLEGLKVCISENESMIGK